MLIGVAAMAGLLMLMPTAGERRTLVASTPVVVIGIALVAGLLARSVAPIPWILVAYGRYAATWVGQNEMVYVGEGVTASVAVTRTPTGVLNYHNAGKVQASSEPQDMRLQRMLGHITTLVPKTPTKVLVIGCGAGVTAGAVSIDPMVKDQTIAEIEPLVPRVVSTHFAEHNFNVVNNPKVKIHLDDARHYLLTTDEKFDAITSDPLDPWVKGAATLYTREFFEVVKEPPQSRRCRDAVRAVVREQRGGGEERDRDVPRGVPQRRRVRQHGQRTGLRPRALRPGRGRKDQHRRRAEATLGSGERRHRKSLSEVGINSAVDLFGTYAGRKSDMKTWLSDAIINTDRNLKLQYLAGLGLNLYQSDAIYKAMIREAKYPADLFEGSPETLAALKGKIDASLSGVSSF